MGARRLLADPGIPSVRIGDPRRGRWRRRAQTIPAMLGITAVAILGAPVILAGAVLVDLRHRRLRLPTARSALFVTQYVLNDSAEILAAPFLWLAAGAGTRLDSVASVRRHERLQCWSVAVLARRAERFMGLRVEVEGEEALTPGPAIVLGRHVSVVDASLPGLLYGVRRGYGVRGVIMAEALADPGFDLLYGRLGSVFVDRDNAAPAREALARMAATLDDRSVAAIFPEGRLFRPGIRDRALGRLAERDPGRAARLAGLRHLLPPRPGGVLALLDGAPDADVVLLGHVGLDAVASFRELARTVPLDRPVTVWCRRLARADIPEGDEARTVWLDERWLELDAEIEDRLAGDR